MLYLHIVMSCVVVVNAAMLYGLLGYTVFELIKSVI